MRIRSEFRPTSQRFGCVLLLGFLVSLPAFGQKVNHREGMQIISAEVDKLMDSTKPGGRTTVRSGDRVYAAVDTGTITKLEKAIASDDPYGIPELVKAGSIFPLASGTLVQVIDRDDNGLTDHTVAMIRLFSTHVERLVQICGSCADAVDPPEPVQANPAHFNLKVRILNGPATGKSGWIRASQVVLPLKMPEATPPGTTPAKQ
jgi:hypothetical protein